MKRKRLDRDLKWGFHHFPYYQTEIDCDSYKGFISLIQLTDGEYCFWNLPKAGKIPVCGKAMLWLQLIPRDSSRLITVMYKPRTDSTDGQKLPYSVSAWYVDVIENWNYDEDGVAIYTDKYLDIIFTPEGDIRIDDKDELDEALKSSDITQEQYDSALKECDLILQELCADVSETEAWCSETLSIIFDKIENGMQPIKKHTQ